MFTTPSTVKQSQNIVNKLYASSRALTTVLAEILCCPHVPGGTGEGKDCRNLYWQVARTALGPLCHAPAGKCGMEREAELYFHKKYQGFKIFLHSALELKQKS